MKKIIYTKEDVNFLTKQFNEKNVYRKKILLGTILSSLIFSINNQIIEDKKRENKRKYNENLVMIPSLSSFTCSCSMMFFINNEIIRKDINKIKKDIERIEENDLNNINKDFIDILNKMEEFKMKYHLNQTIKLQIKNLKKIDYKYFSKNLINDFDFVNFSYDQKEIILEKRNTSFKELFKIIKKSEVYIYLDNLSTINFKSKLDNNNEMNINFLHNNFN